MVSCAHAVYCLLAPQLRSCRGACTDMIIASMPALTGSGGVGFKYAQVR